MRYTVYVLTPTRFVDFKNWYHKNNNLSYSYFIDKQNINNWIQYVCKNTYRSYVYCTQIIIEGYRLKTREYEGLSEYEIKNKNFKLLSLVKTVKISLTDLKNNQFNRNTRRG